MKSIFERIADSLLDVIISAVLSLTGSYIATCTFLDVQRIPEEGVKIASAIFVLSMIVCIMVIRFFRNSFRYKYRIRELEVIVEYRGDSVKVTDTYKVSTYRIFQTQMYTSRTWFTGEYIKLRAKPKKYKIKKIREAGNKHEYYVVFPKKLSFWQKPISFKTELMGGNKSRQFENFYWYDVICPVDKIIFDIRIPASMCDMFAEMKAFKVYEDEEKVRREKLEYNCGFKYEVTKPKVGYSYKLEWKWAGEELAVRNGKQPNKS